MSRNVCDLFCILFWLFRVSVSGLLKLDMRKLMQESIGQAVGCTHLWYSSDLLAWDIYSDAWDIVIKFLLFELCYYFVPDVLW
jgi:hypothetical protein